MTARFIAITLIMSLSSAPFLVSQASAQNVCAPVLVLPSTLQTSPYDPFAISPLIEDTAIGFRDANCEGELSVDATIGLGNEQPLLRNNGRELAFQFSFAGQDIVAQPIGLNGPGTLLNSVNFLVPQGTTGTLAQQVRIIVPEGQIVAPGRYSFYLPAIAQNASGVLTQTRGTLQVRATPIVISTQVLSVMKLGVLGCDLSSDSALLAERPAFGDEFSSGCKLNLGDPSVGLVDGDSRRARLIAQANVNFKIAMISRNGGVLRLAGSIDDTKQTERVHYSASLQGQGQNSEFVCNGASCGTSDLIEPSSSPLGNDLYFQVRIRDPDMMQKRAGRYVDVITLIIQPAS